MPFPPNIAGAHSLVVKGCVINSCQLNSSKNHLGDKPLGIYKKDFLKCVK